METPTPCSRWQVVLGTLPLFIVVVFLVTPSAFPQDSQTNRATLKGLKSVGVVVEHLSEDVQRNGLTVSQIQTDIELRLRMAGIKVVPPADSFLYVAVSMVKLSAVEGYVFVVQIQYEQWVILDRDPTAFLVTETWSAPLIFGTVSVDQLSSLRENVKDLVDQFINAYLEQNPKR